MSIRCNTQQYKCACKREPARCGTKTPHLFRYSQKTQQKHNSTRFSVPQHMPSLVMCFLYPWPRRRPRWQATGRRHTTPEHQSARALTQLRRCTLTSCVGRHRRSQSLNLPPLDSPWGRPPHARGHACLSQQLWIASHACACVLCALCSVRMLRALGIHVNRHRRTSRFSSRERRPASPDEV